MLRTIRRLRAFLRRFTWVFRMAPSQRREVADQQQAYRAFMAEREHE